MKPLRSAWSSRWWCAGVSVLTAANMLFLCQCAALHESVAHIQTPVTDAHLRTRMSRHGAEGSPGVQVMYDASGVRLHAGRQASVLNMIITELPPDHPVSDTRPLRDTLGHTPLQARPAPHWPFRFPVLCSVCRMHEARLVAALCVTRRFATAANVRPCQDVDDEEYAL